MKLGWRLCRVNLGLLDVALGREYFSTRAHWLRPALQEELARIWFFRASAAFFPDLFEINHVQAAIFSPKIWGNIRKPLTMTSFETLELTSVDAHVLLVRLNRPEAANAFNTQMAWDLINLFEGLALQPENTRVVVITGAGEKAFCAGGDLKERNGMSDAAWQAQHLIYERIVRAVIACPLPTIGAINGAEIGRASCRERV